MDRATEEILKQAADALLAEAHRYWRAYRDAWGGAAVVWLEDSLFAVVIHADRIGRRGGGWKVG